MQRHYEQVGTENNSEELINSRFAPPSQNILPAHADKNQGREQFLQDSDSHAIHTVQYVTDQGSVLYSFLNFWLHLCSRFYNELS
jgi:hypothetical protein